MYKNILIPTDGSDLSEKVIKPGIALAKTFSAKITGVYVYPFFRFYPETRNSEGGSLPSREEMAERAKASVSEFIERMQAAVRAAGVGFDSIMLQDDQVWKGIIDAAHKRGCDLIMMAAHGRRGVSGLVLGSETNKVLTHSKIPVLVYR